MNRSPEVHEAGSGEALLLLHGVGGDWTIWKPLLPLLTPHFRVIAPTLPGHPGGMPLTGAPTVAAIADALVAQLRARGIRQAHVAGNSLGGWLAVELARRGFAKSVTALSPAGGWKAPCDLTRLVKTLLTQFRLIPIVYVLAWLFMGFAAVRAALSKLTMQHGERVPAPEFRAMLRQFRGSRLMPALFGNTRAEDGVQPLPDAALPLTIAWSEQDQVLPYDRYGEPYRERFPQAEHTGIAGAGHVPMYDAPEAVAAVITATCRRAVEARA